MPVPNITPDEIARGAAAALRDVARLEAITNQACFDTRAFLSGVLLTAAENVRGTPAHATFAKLLAQVRCDLPTPLDTAVLPAVWLATCEEERVGGALVVLRRAWPSETAARAWGDHNAEVLAGLGFGSFTPILVPVKEP
jgi:hypothetical protein